MSYLDLLTLDAQLNVFSTVYWMKMLAPVEWGACYVQ